MKVKKGADVKGLSEQVWFALGVCAAESRQLGVGLVVTSGRDGAHRPGSLHYTGNAVDIRTRDLSPAAQKDFHEYLKGLLDRLGFDVVLERDHLHIEWDPKKTDIPWLQEVA